MESEDSRRDRDFTRKRGGRSGSRCATENKTDCPCSAFSCRSSHVRDFPEERRMPEIARDVMYAWITGARTERSQCATKPKAEYHWRTAVYRSCHMRHAPGEVLKPSLVQRIAFIRGRGLEDADRDTTAMAAANHSAVQERRCSSAPRSPPGRWHTRRKPSATITPPPRRADASKS